MFQTKKQTLEEEKIKNNVEVLTFLGIGTEFKGKVVFQGTLRVDGIIEGEIDGSDTLILGETGSINGVCKVAKAILSGKVRGEVYASEKVVLKKNTDFNGKIVTPSLIVEEGASFNGSCKMGREFPQERVYKEEHEVSVVKL